MQAMTTSAITMRNVSFTLSRSATTFAGRPSNSFRGKQRALMVVRPSFNLHDFGKMSRRISVSFPSFNWRCFCTSSEPETLTAENSNIASSVPNVNSNADSPSSPSKDPIQDAAGILDFRVGHILKAWRHPEADTLYVEEVDVGEPEPRIICSGLVKYIPLETLQDLKVIVLANLKPRNMRGVKSNGMLLAASDASHENVELLLAPEGSVVGERIWFGSEDEKDDQSPAATPNYVQKKKIWEMVQPHLKTDGFCVATLGANLMRTSAGSVECSSLKNANIG